MALERELLVRSPFMLSLTYLDIFRSLYKRLELIYVLKLSSFYKKNFDKVFLIGLDDGREVIVKLLDPNAGWL